jgi:hypothetical protein
VDCGRSDSCVAELRETFARSRQSPVRRFRFRLGCELLAKGGSKDTEIVPTGVGRPAESTVEARRKSIEHLVAGSRETTIMVFPSVHSKVSAFGDTRSAAVTAPGVTSTSVFPTALEERLARRVERSAMPTTAHVERPLGRREADVVSVAIPVGRVALDSRFLGAVEALNRDGIIEPSNWIALPTVRGCFTAN